MIAPNSIDSATLSEERHQSCGPIAHASIHPSKKESTRHNEFIIRYNIT